ncbi:MAG: trypsin-like peptidase domain-containing protein [Planctomycetales bacterium]
MSRLPVVVLLTLLVCSALPLHAEDPPAVAAADPIFAIEKTIVSTVEAVEPAVVAISRLRRVAVESPLFDERPNAPFPLDPMGNSDDPDSPDFLPHDFGSGVVIAVDGEKAAAPRTYILTNYHVVRGGPTGKGGDKPEAALHVRFANRKGYYAQIHAADPRSDLAVIRIEAAEGKALKMVDGPLPKKGQFVLALGNPYALARDGSASVSWGIVSNITRRPDPRRNASVENSPKAETLQDLGHLLQVDTRLNLGVSGGALVNVKGELMGITTSLAAISGYEKSVGFAVPIDTATRRIIQTLLEGKEVEYGFLGVTLNPRSGFAVFDMHRNQGRSRVGGVLVANVLPNSPAAKGGMRDGDVVIAVNDVPVYSRPDLMREVGKLPPEAKAQLTVLRGFEANRVNLSVAVGKWPVLDEEGIITSQRLHPLWRGIEVDYPTGRSRLNALAPGSGPFPSAVLVTEVVTPSPAAQSQVEVGSLIEKVNDTPVSTPREFEQAVRNSKGDVSLTLAGGQKVVVGGP